MTGNAADGTTGSPLRQRMIDQMRIANLAESTRITYIGEIEHLARHYKACLTSAPLVQIEVIA